MTATSEKRRAKMDVTQGKIISLEDFSESTTHLPPLLSDSLPDVQEQETGVDVPSLL